MRRGALVLAARSLARLTFERADCEAENASSLGSSKTKSLRSSRYLRVVSELDLAIPHFASQMSAKFTHLAHYTPYIKFVFDLDWSHISFLGFCIVGQHYSASENAQTPA